MEFLSVVPDEAGVAVDRSMMREYERRLELSLTEKERADAVNLIISMFKQRLQDGRRTEISQ